MFKIPKNPITIFINETITKSFFESFAKKYLPTFKPVVTSAFRTEEKNREVGGVPDSAHLYGLALDFYLTDPDTGQFIGQERQSQAFNQFIKPYWPESGYALDEETHIHLNLDRKITQATSVLGMGAIAILLYWFYRKLKPVKPKTKGITTS